MESALYKKYVGSPCKKSKIDPKKPIQLEAVDLGVIKTKRYIMPNSYKEGDYATEDDIEKSSGNMEDGQTFSKVKKDKKGNNYVTRLNED